MTKVSGAKIASFWKMVSGHQNIQEILDGTINFEVIIMFYLDVGSVTVHGPGQLCARAHAGEVLAWRPFY